MEFCYHRSSNNSFPTGLAQSAVCVWVCFFVFLMHLKLHVHTYHFPGNRWSSHDAAAVSPTAKGGTRRRLPALGTKTHVSPRQPSLWAPASSRSPLCPDVCLCPWPPVFHLMAFLFSSSAVLTTQAWFFFFFCRKWLELFLPLWLISLEHALVFSLMTEAEGNSTPECLDWSSFVWSGHQVLIGHY